MHVLTLNIAGLNTILANAMDASNRKHSENLSKCEQSNHTVDKSDIECLHVLEDEHILDSYMLLLSEYDRWFVGCDGSSVAEEDVIATKHISLCRVSHLLKDEGWKLWLRDLYENAVA